MLAYVFLLATATLQQTAEDPAVRYEDTDRPVDVRRVVCWDGSRATNLALCPKPAPDRSRYLRPRNNPGSWATTNDYPSKALMELREGTAGFRLTVGPTGIVTHCEITSTSGWSDLDAATCSNVTRRARFDPALDRNGEPTTGFYSNRVSWAIPSEPSYAEQIDARPNGPTATFGEFLELAESDYPAGALQERYQGIATVELDVSAKGRVENCRISESTGSVTLDARSCELASEWKFSPGRDAAGGAVADQAVFEFWWYLPD
jgi:TonB family protein